MIYIGVDPGKKGGFAIIQDEKHWVLPWDEEHFVEEMAGVMNLGKCVACVEQVGAMPGQGVVSMFSFGKNAGFIEGVLSGLGIPYQLVLPKKWKAEFTLNGKDKAASVAVCKRLFPGVDLRATEKCKKDSDGMAEALLMAEYARRKF